MKKLLTLVTFIYVATCAYAQSNMYVVGGLEGGWLTTKYSNTDKKLPKSIIDSETGNYNLKAAVSFMMAWDNLSAEVGISQSLRYWTLQGSANNYDLSLKSTQSFPSIFTGGYYQIPLFSSNVDLSLYGGTQISLDFVNYNELNEKTGVENDYMIAKTKESSKIGINLIPEIGIKGYFRNENFWQLGVRYNLPLMGNNVEGSLEHYINGKPISGESVTYNADGSYIGLVFKYGFLLQR